MLTMDIEVDPDGLVTPKSPETGNVGKVALGIADAVDESIGEYTLCELSVAIRSG